MLLSTSPVQEQLADAVRGTLRDAGGPAAARRAETEGNSYDRDLWDRLNGIGVAGLAASRTPEDGSLEDAAIVAFELGYVVAPVPFLESSVLPARLLLAASAGALQNDLLERISSGELVPSAAARDGGGGCVVRNGKLFGGADLVRADHTGLLLQLAVNEDGRHVLCLVELSAARTGRRSSIGRVPLIDVRYEEVEIVEAFEIPRPELALQQVHAVTAAWWAGASKALVDMAAAYAKERRQFDRPIGAFQAIQHRLADMAVLAEGSRLIALRACARAALAEMTERDALEAWLVAGDGAQRCAAGAHQVFGGYGFTVDFDVQLFSRRVRALQFWLTDPVSVELRLGAILRLDAEIQSHAVRLDNPPDGAHEEAPRHRSWRAGPLMR